VEYVATLSSNVVLIDSEEINKDIKVLVIPSVLSSLCIKDKNLPMVDPHFSRFLNIMLSFYKEDPITIIGFGYSALSLYNRLGKGLDAISGFSELRPREHSIDISQIDMLKEAGINKTWATSKFDHIFANPNHRLDDNLSFGSQIQKKNNEVFSEQFKNYTSFSSKLGKIDVIGLLTEPHLHDNLPNSFEYKLTGLIKGDILSNYVIKNSLE
jgi:hypothetical protein